tara:strand:- start:1509 stop:2153 length:645 start_codon:yes stop_codon:yes gene_type:complete
MKSYSFKFYFWSLLFSVFFASLNTASAQVELKVNLPLAAVLVPNLGIEFQVGKKTSLQLDVLGSFWDSIDGDPLLITQTFLEFRYYQNNDTSGWFVGGHLGFGMFTLQKPYDFIIYDYYNNGSNPDPADGTFKSGRSGFHGLSLGYKKRLNDRWALEAFVGGGYTMSWYKGYNGMERTDVDEDNYRDFNGSGEVVLYRGGLMLTYQLHPYKNKQ